MKYYFLDNHLVNSSRDVVDPNPVGFIRILESGNIDPKEDLHDVITFTKITFFMAYERENGEYKIIFGNQTPKLSSCHISKELNFDGLGGLFKTENFDNIFSTKRLAISVAKNMMNNLIFQFHTTLTQRFFELKREQMRYNSFSKMLNTCKNKLDKIK